MRENRWEELNQPSSTLSRAKSVHRFQRGWNQRGNQVLTKSRTNKAIEKKLQTAVRKMLKRRPRHFTAIRPELNKGRVQRGRRPKLAGTNARMGAMDAL